MMTSRGLYRLCLVFVLAGPTAVSAQTANAPPAAATAATAATAIQQGEVPINDVVRQLEQRSRLLDARQATLEEQERLLAERIKIQDERELQLREGERQLAEGASQLAEGQRQLAEGQGQLSDREQLLTTQIPLPPEGNLGLSAPGTASPAGPPTPPRTFREPDAFNPGHDNQTFQPGVPNNFSAGPQDTRNNFISP